MVLTCECDHKRSEHLGGKDTHRDKYVFKCQHENCTCKHYRPDEQTRKYFQGLYLQSSVFPLICTLIGLGIFLAFSVAFDTWAESFIIEPTTITKTFYANGTEIVLDDSTNGLSIMTLPKAVLGLTIFAVLYSVWVFYPDNKITQTRKELMKDG